MNWYKQAKKTDTLFSAPLRKTKKGFYYLDIPQSFATGLFKMVADDKLDESPYKQKSYGGIGAHVSVISEEELDEGTVVKEIGENFEFSLLGSKCTNPDGWDEMKQVCFVEIDSPQIKEMRISYGLPKTYKAKGHNFHITFAMEKVS